ncbi:multidrug resistance-associated protein 4-like protein [Leptotrombidium deliense]|uniref:Multidrug resistance-associated protein 4-like protein n=1 Tax=Leptotrombidium deliense TaxID=299467 RepID=A0A443S332_9ACAR|nr:multidrug resistance-associated protein 4-like protein [Leptotrombidium deliense]
MFEGTFRSNIDPYDEYTDEAIWNILHSVSLAHIFKANIDHETDALIQMAIKKCLKSCTVLTIAHRLNTVIDMDKILVLDDGRIVEYDVPFLLLNKSDGHFKNIVSQLGEQNAADLYELAKKQFEKCEFVTHF